MKNKFAIALALTGALTGISIGVGQVILENMPPSAQEVAAIARYKAQQAEAQRQQQAAEAKAESEKLARCAKDDVEAAICDRYLEALAQIEDAQKGDSYGAYLDRQAQRRNDLAYCRQNPSDWSCTDGQYRGQY